MNINERKWNAHVQAWATGGLSQKQYCSEHKLAISTFQLWRKRLRDAEGGGTDLVEVPRKANLLEHHARGLEIQTAGITLRLPANTKPEFIAQIVKALEGR